MERNNTLVGACIVLGGLFILAGIFNYVGTNLHFLDALWPFLLVFAGLACVSGENHTLLGVGLLIASLFIMAYKYSFTLSSGTRSILGVCVLLVGIVLLAGLVKPKE